MSQEETTSETFNETQEGLLKNELKKLPLASGVFNWVARFSRFGQRLVDSWHKLHGNQKIYLLAIAAFFLNVSDFSNDVNEPMLWVGGIALIAMGRELWDIFTRIWDSTFGKSMVLVIYAIIANFTLAIASQKINMIVGVSPSRLIYTQGLTTLVLLPFWLLLLSLLAMTFIFIAAQLKLFVFGLLNWLHIHRTPIRKKEHLSGVFFFIRIMLLPLVIMTLAQALEWYAERVHIGNLSVNLSENESEENREVILAVGEIERDKVDKAAVESKVEETNKEETNKENEKPDADDKNNGIFNSKIGDVDKAIARFVYNFETFPNSRCVLAKGERAVPINENDILVAIKDKTTEIGYRFSARACELKPGVTAMDAKDNVE